jgi:RND family efflux transporter MFP subunit
MKRTFITSLLVLPTVLLLQSCGGNAEEPTEEILKPLVKLETATRTHFTHKIRVQGNVETDQDITLSSEMGGLITIINVKEGQRVSKGQVIAQVDASVLSSNLAELNTQLEYAKYMLKKQQELKDRGVGSEFDLESAKSNVEAIKASMNSLSTQRGKAEIRAPFNGVIDQVFAKQGQMAGPASPIVRLVNNTNVDIVASISEKHFAKVHVGTSIEVNFPNYSDTVVQLKIQNVGNYIEPTNRTFRIKSTIEKNDYFLPNMLAEVSITDMDVENGLVIPSVSILKDQDNFYFVYTVERYKGGKGKNDYLAKKVKVNVIERYDGMALISEGIIKEGVSIVVEGARGISDNDIVRIK